MEENTSEKKSEKLMDKSKNIDLANDEVEPSSISSVVISERDSSEQLEPTKKIKKLRKINKKNLYSKPFYKSNFRFLGKRVKENALKILRKRKRQRKLKDINKTLNKKLGDDEDQFSRAEFLSNSLKRKNFVFETHSIVKKLRKNLEKIERELVVMKTKE